MKRRSFLKSSSAASIPFFLKGMGVQVLSKSALFKALNLETDRVLVLIQLNGGNDGLSTVLPLDQYSNLANARSNILIPESSALELTAEVGLHPVMTGMKELFDDARLNIVQGVGYPNQNRSHFRSTDIWTSASPAEEFWTTGWLGRHSDVLHPGYPDGYPNEDFPDPIAITIGSFVSETCQGTVSNFSLAINDPFNLNPLATGGEDEVPDTPYGEELTFLRQTIEQTNAYSEVIETAANGGNNLAVYPDDNRLANQLKNIALLISGGLQTKIYVASLGGFDTHAAQIGDTPTVGTHADLLKQLSDAVAAFQEDLRLLGLEERVIGMTFSEFGRRIKSNVSLGTDHGSAAPLFLFGSCVNPGLLGENPEIPEEVGTQDGVAMQYDFRNVYGSVLMDWFEVEESTVKQLLFDGFQHLPILEPCTAVSTSDMQDEPGAIEAYNYPNPFRETTTIHFSCRNERARLSIYDARGSELEVLFDKRLSAGGHEVVYDGRHLPAGTYYFRLQLEGSRQKTKLMVKS